MDSGILMIQDSILACSPDPRIPHTAHLDVVRRTPRVCRMSDKLDLCCEMNDECSNVLIESLQEGHRAYHRIIASTYQHRQVQT
jgi:hypothetical protein